MIFVCSCTSAGHAQIHTSDGEFITGWLLLGPFPAVEWARDFFASIDGEANVRHKDGDGIIIASGDTLLLMSDGLPEMFNEASQILDYPTMKKLVEEVTHELPQAIIDYLVAAGEKWTNGRAQEDDVTMVVVKVAQPALPQALIFTHILGTGHRGRS
ncbi:serine/threonine-protein phosphatase [candidate division KSB1 bacterium]|nr:serine/threonine-protein phosphatase [candidate division KSB1 bacterium]